MKPAIAIVSKQRIVGATNGSSTYLIALARSLVEAGFKVNLIQPSPDIFGRTPIMRLGPELAVFESHAIRATIAIGSWRIVLSPLIWLAAMAGVARKLLRKAGIVGAWTEDRPRAYSVATEWKEADKAFIERNIPGDTSVVIADYIFCTPAFAALPPSTATAILMHDLFHARKGDGKDSVAFVQREVELEMLSLAHVVFAIQEEERRFISDHLPETRAILVPMPADVAAAPTPGNDDSVLFVGSNTAPNSVGLSWFFSEVWPLVLSERPNCVLRVAGTVDRAFERQNQPNVRFLGMVPDLAALYREAGVVISPLTFGSGLKIKLIEALAAGKAVVATSITLQGVTAQCDGAVICTDNAREFANALVRYCADFDARTALAQSALACARSHFTAEAVHRDLRNWAMTARN